MAEKKYELLGVVKPVDAKLNDSTSITHVKFYRLSGYTKADIVINEVIKIKGLPMFDSGDWGYPGFKAKSGKFYPSVEVKGGFNEDRDDDVLNAVNSAFVELNKPAE